MTPLELPGLNIASSPPEQAARSPLPPLPPSVTQEMNAEPVRSPENNPYLSTPPSHNLATAPGLPPQQPQPNYYPSNNAALPPFRGEINPNGSAQVFPTFIPSNQGYFLQGYPNHTLTPMPSNTAPQPRDPSIYPFVAKATPPTISQNQYRLGTQYSQVAGTPNYMPPTSPQTAPTMVLRPDGLWQQIPNPGVQRVPSGRNNSTSAAPVNYPPGVYEMAS